MNLEKLKPWNWFKHEEGSSASTGQMPVARAEAAPRGASRRLAGYGPLGHLQREIDRLFDDVFTGFGLSDTSGSRDRITADADWFRPSVDVSGDEQRYQITLDVPGVKQSDLSIEVRGDVLSVKGRKQEQREHKDQQFYRIERSYGAFQRTLALPEDADADNIKAVLNDGVLKLQIPRRPLPAADVKRIQIGSD